MVLALDTATPTVSAAVCEVVEGTSVVVAQRAETDGRRHAELLAPMVADVLAAGGVAMTDLAQVVVGVGPGPFTGLRVGITTAVTLGFAADIPVVGVCSLDAVAARAAAGGLASCVVLTDARRREVYWAQYDVGRRVEGPHVDRPGALVERLGAAPPPVVGPGRQLAPPELQSQAPPLADTLQAADLVVALTRNEALAPRPLYLRRPDATLPGPPKPVTATR